MVRLPFSVAVALALLWCCLPVTLAEDDKGTDVVQDQIDRFLKACDDNKELTDEQRGKAKEVVEKLREDKDVQDAVITEALRAIYPEFDEAMKAFVSEQVDEAIPALSRLRKSEDPYLAVDAAYFYARANIFAEKFEDALPSLSRLLKEQAEHTLYAAEAQFYKGICHARLLDRDSAVAALTKFLGRESRVSQRIENTAEEALDFLLRAKDGSMDDIAEHMSFSRRHLSLKYSGVTTQETQDEIVAMLDKLIEEAEAQEKQGQGQGQGQGKKQGQGSKSGGGQKAGSGGGGVGQQGPKTVRKLGSAQKSAWDSLRARDRGVEAFSAIKGKFPARYQQLVEQYYRELQEEQSSAP